MFELTACNIIGYLAAICMILGYMPQAIYTIRTRDTDGIAHSSLWVWAVFSSSSKDL